MDKWINRPYINEIICMSFIRILRIYQEKQKKVSNTYKTSSQMILMESRKGCDCTRTFEKWMPRKVRWIITFVRLLYLGFYFKFILRKLAFSKKEQISFPLLVSPAALKEWSRLSSPLRGDYGVMLDSA